MITLRRSVSVWQHSNIFLKSAGILNQKFGRFRNMKSIEGHKIFYSIFSFPISIFGKYFKGFQTFETRFLWCIQWQQSEKKLIMKVSSCKFQIKQKWYNRTLTSWAWARASGTLGEYKELLSKFRYSSTTKGVDGNSAVPILLITSLASETDLSLNSPA